MARHPVVAEGGVLGEGAALDALVVDGEQPRAAHAVELGQVAAAPEPGDACVEDLEGKSILSCCSVAALQCCSVAMEGGDQRGVGLPDTRGWQGMGQVSRGACSHGRWVGGVRRGSTLRDMLRCRRRPSTRWCCGAGSRARCSCPAAAASGRRGAPPARSGCSRTGRARTW